MKKISRRSFMAAAAVSVAALALTACGGSASSAASSVASSAASSEAVSSAAAAELTTVEAGKLTMATNATFPPYEMTTDSGEIEGIDVDTAKAIAEKLGLELQIDDMEFDAALLSVQQGKADIVMAGVTVTDERKAVMDFSDSYATGIQSIIVPNDSDIASPDDLALFFPVLGIERKRPDAVLFERDENFPAIGFRARHLDLENEIVCRERRGDEQRAPEKDADAPFAPIEHGKQSLGARFFGSIRSVCGNRLTLFGCV